MSEATGGADPQREGETRAIAALVCGVLSVFVVIVFPVALVLGIVAIVLGRSVRRDHTAGTTYGLATGGFVAGIIGTALASMVLLIVLFLVPLRTTELRFGGEPVEVDIEPVESQDLEG